MKSSNNPILDTIENSLNSHRITEKAIERLSSTLLNIIWKNWEVLSCNDVEKEVTLILNITIKLVCEKYNIQVEQILQKNREAQIANIRFIFMYILHIHFWINFPTIWKALNKAHSTIKNGVQKIEDMCEMNDFENEINLLWEKAVERYQHQKA